MGHYAMSYPDRLLKLQETQENDKDDTHDADKLMMHEVVYLNNEKVTQRKYEEKCGENSI